MLIPDKLSGDMYTADELTTFKNESQNVIETSGQTLSALLDDQLVRGISTYVGSGTFYADSGAADAYVVTVNGGKINPFGYQDGQIVRVDPANLNQTEEPDINVAGLGDRPIKGLRGGDMSPGSTTELVYNTAITGFEPSTGQRGLMSSFKNKLINGDFTIWIDANIFTKTYDAASNFDLVTPSDVFKCKRWFTDTDDNDVDVTRTLLPPSEPDLPGQNSNYITVETTAAIAGDITLLAQRIENVTTLSGRTCTFSCFLRTSGVAGEGFNTPTFKAYHYDGSGAKPGTEVISQALAGVTTSWQKFEFTFDLPVHPAFNIPNDTFLQVGFHDVSGGNSAFIDIAQCQLEAGATSSPFEDRLRAIEDQLCDRYMRVYNAVSGIQYEQGATDLANYIIDVSTMRKGVFAVPISLPLTVGYTATGYADVPVAFPTAIASFVPETFPENPLQGMFLFRKNITLQPGLVTGTVVVVTSTTPNEPLLIMSKEL